MDDDMLALASDGELHRACQEPKQTYSVMERQYNTKDQYDLIMVFQRLSKSLSPLVDIYVEYRRQHPDADPVKNRNARIRNVLQRNCETSKRFKNGDGR